MQVQTQLLETQAGIEIQQQTKIALQLKILQEPPPQEEEFLQTPETQQTGTEPTTVVQILIAE